MALAIDHRAQLEAMADAAGAPRERITAFKRLAVAAAAKVADGRPGFGMLLDETYGREALFDAAKHPFWIGRPVELPGSRPLRFEGGADIGSRLVEWPVTHTIKCLVLLPSRRRSVAEGRAVRRLAGLHDAARRLGRELLIEIIAGKHGEIDDDTVALVLDELYRRGIKPDWWKLEPQPSAGAWEAIAEVDRGERSVVPRRRAARAGCAGGGADAAFAVAAGAPMVNGFAVGRTIFAEPARAWLAGKIDDAAAVDAMAGRFAGLVQAWEDARAGKAALSCRDRDVPDLKVKPSSARAGASSTSRRRAPAGPMSASTCTG